MQNLKVGQSFEVVEVIIDSDYRGQVFKAGGFTIRSISNGYGFSHVLTNGPGWINGFVKRDLFCNKGLFLEDHEVKPIGKLTIKSLK